MQIKQAQHKNGRKVRSIKTSGGLDAGIGYAADPNDPRHRDKVRIPKPYGLRCRSVGDFKAQAVDGFERYLEASEGAPGAKTKGEIVEQLIINPDPLSDLTDDERMLIFQIVARLLSPESAVLGYWHVGINGRDRDDCHIFVCNTLQHGDPALRKTELLKSSPKTRNYRELLRFVENEIVTELNLRRLDQGRKLLPTNDETRAIRLSKRAQKPIPTQIAERLNFRAKSVTKHAVVKTLEEMNFEVDWDQDLLKIKYPPKVRGEKRKKDREDSYRWKTLWPRIVNACDDKMRKLEKMRKRKRDKEKSKEAEERAQTDRVSKRKSP
ncbi:hypothetical protein QEH56_16055 [Pelagicoccus enzymogenes]|uniref:hypothetical protein n=1 Tax=Pelagicoccus enzymogenes TaxID=2773457 RepID=UPI00280C8483|nr:hypothetical protein [Pelagicoccus enzymogenes]MDQ8199676.1 hypothetical protein [Pelagicoccus enzymogenes]